MDHKDCFLLSKACELKLIEALELEVVLDLIGSVRIRIKHMTGKII